MSEPRTMADETRAGFHATVLEALPEAVVVATSEGAITFANKAAESLLGYRADEIVGKPITLVAPPEPGRRVDAVKWLARWAAAPDVDQYRFLDLTLRRKDGRDIAAEVRVRAGRVADEERYFISLRDNTARRREQVSLKIANLRAARILMVAEDAIVSVDAGRRIVFFNPAAERMFGYRSEDVMGEPLSILIPEKARLAHERYVEEFRESKDASRLMSDRSEVLGARRSGEVFPVEATITKVMAAGELTYTAHLRDVTERNRARDRLRESERRVRAVFDHATEALALLAPDGAVLEINGAAAALTAGDRPLVGAPLWEAPWLGAGVSVDGAADALKTAVLAASKGTPTRLSAELTRDGAPLPVEVRLTPIPDARGEVAYVLAEGRYDG